MIQLERQLNFDIARGDVVALEAHPLLRGAESSAPKRLRSVYFDTDDDDIWEAGAVLCVRHEDDRKVQVIESGGFAGASMQRDEVEHDIDGDFPELSAARGTCLEQVLEKRRIRDRLAPRFEVAVERSIWTIHFDSAELEVSLDRGKIEAAAAATELCEVELTLKSGDVTSLYQAARRLGANVPLHLNLVSKGERGYRLVQGSWDRPEKARSIRLRPGMPAGVALQTIDGQCLKHFLLNERLLHDADEAEPVHQARIAIRRLRAAFTFFKPFAGDEKSASLAQQLKWISDLLGAARDLDVFQSEVIEEAYAKDSAPGLDELAAEVESRRRAAYERLTGALGSARFRELLVDLAEWLDIGDRRGEPDTLARARCDEKIEVFAALELERRSRRLVKRALHLDKLDDPHRHRIRITAKKLRYMAEFFAHLFPARNAQYERFCHCLEELQTILGELNDRLVAGRFLAHLAEEIPRRKRLGKDAAMLFAAGRIGRGLELIDKSKLVRRAADTARKLADTTPFWQ
jgi:inorganic triphosphatase YgiF